MNPFANAERVYLGDLPPSRRDSVQRCRDIEEIVTLAESKGYYRNYGSIERNLIIFHAYCTGSMTYEQLAAASQLNITTIHTILSRVIMKTMENEGDIIMNRVTKKILI